MQGQVPYVISAAGWTFVGVKWGNRAIMIGSSISATAVAMDLVRALTNWRQRSAWCKSRVEESQSTSAASVTSPTVTYNISPSLATCAPSSIRPNRVATPSDAEPVHHSHHRLAAGRGFHPFEKSFVLDAHSSGGS